MRVLMTADAVGGVWTYALDLSAALAPHDICVVLATMGPRPSDAQRAAVERLGNVELLESDYRLEWMADPWRDVSSAGQWLLELAKDTAADIVHLNGYTLAALPWQRPVVCVAHSCVVSWWHAVHREQPPAQWDTYRKNVSRGLHSADRVIAPTQAFLEQLQGCYGFKRPAEVIRNGRPWTAMHVDEQREQILVGCGRLWDAAKNLAVFDRAAEGLPWPAYVIGDAAGPDGQTFCARALHPLGALSHVEVAARLQRASIFVHPALYEPFGLAVLEAANAGCALVLADLPTLRELWDGAAEFFNPCDSAQLHAALNVLIADSAKRDALAVAARQRAAEYHVELTAAAYARTYRSLAAGDTRQSSGARAVA